MSFVHLISLSKKVDSPNQNGATCKYSYKHYKHRLTFFKDQGTGYSSLLHDQLSTASSLAASSVQRYPSNKGKRLLKPDEIVNVKESCKMPEFLEKSPFSGSE